MKKIKPSASLLNFEDTILGHLAKERDENSCDTDFISSEKLKKKLGI